MEWYWYTLIVVGSGIVLFGLWKLVQNLFLVGTSRSRARAESANEYPEDRKRVEKNLTYKYQWVDPTVRQTKASMNRFVENSIGRENAKQAGDRKSVV